MADTLMTRVQVNGKKDGEKVNEQTQAREMVLRTVLLDPQLDVELGARAEETHKTREQLIREAVASLVGTPASR